MAADKEDPVLTESPHVGPYEPKCILLLQDNCLFCSKYWSIDNHDLVENIFSLFFFIFTIFLLEIISSLFIL